MHAKSGFRVSKLCANYAGDQHHCGSHKWRATPSRPLHVACVHSPDYNFCRYLRGLKCEVACQTAVSRLCTRGVLTATWRRHRRPLAPSH